MSSYPNKNLAIKYLELKSAKIKRIFKEKRTMFVGCFVE
jgi:hypothetical protein